MYVCKLKISFFTLCLVGPENPSRETLIFTDSIVYKLVLSFWSNSAYPVASNVLPTAVGAKYNNRRIRFGVHILLYAFLFRNRPKKEDISAIILSGFVSLQERERETNAELTPTIHRKAGWLPTHWEQKIFRKNIYLYLANNKYEGNRVKQVK